MHIKYITKLIRILRELGLTYEQICFVLTHLT